MSYNRRRKDTEKLPTDFTFGHVMLQMAIKEVIE